MSTEDRPATRRRLAIAGLAAATAHFTYLAVLFVLSRIVFAEGIPDATTTMTSAAWALNVGAKYGVLPLVATFWISAALALIAARDRRVSIVPVAATFVLLAAAVPLVYLAYGVWGSMGW